MTDQQTIIITRVAKKLNLKFDQVAEVFESDFRTMVKEIKKFDINDPKTHHVFLIPNFGKFVVNYKKAKRINDRLKENDSGTIQE